MIRGVSTPHNYGVNMGGRNMNFEDPVLLGWENRAHKIPIRFFFETLCMMRESMFKSNCLIIIVPGVIFAQIIPNLFPPSTPFTLAWNKVC